MRKFVMSDIHGSYNEMMKLFEYVKFNPNEDELVVAGDMINRGPLSGEVLREIKYLHEHYETVHVTIGNHEEMMLWYIDGKHPMWSQFEGARSAATINNAFGKYGVAEAVAWIRNLPLIYEDERCIFAHAGFRLPFETAKGNRDNLWLPKKEFYRIPAEVLLGETCGKIIVHGHTPVKQVTFDGARIAIDLGAQVVPNGKLSCLELAEGAVYEYDFSSKRIYHKKIVIKS
ncbi:hypothetical protein FZC66_10100 [Priestia megaterium]|nr:hypothetical protein FZC66_10100 [Priestia megaterium]